MKNRQERLRSIGFWAIPPKGSPDYQRVMDFLKEQETPETRAKAKAAYEIATSTITAIEWNSSDLPSSKTLRYYLNEYNHRAFQHGLHSMPTSFAFTESFFDYLPKYNFFNLKPEKEFLFSFLDFLDWETSTGENATNDSIISSLEEGVIFSFNVSQNPKLIEFNLNSGNSICIVAVCLLRIGYEITVLVEGGESGKESASTDFEKIRPFLGKENIRPDPGLTRQIVMLEGTHDRQRVIAITRFDLSDKTSSFRYYAEDFGDSFRTYTDDADTYKSPDGTMTEESKLAFNTMEESLKEREPIFQLCKTFLSLPIYAEYYIEFTKLQQYESEIKKRQKSLKDKKIIEKSLSSAKIFTRTIHEIIPPEETTSYSSITINSTSFQNDLAGYWKRLLPWEIGVQKDGKTETKGRTWVKLEPVQKQADEQNLTKSKITGHRVDVKPAPKGPNYGFIYVLRNPQYDRDIYKVGFTTRTSDIRANELSRTTGIIDNFAVMNDWEVSDCKIAEKRIHQKLEHFRIRDKREFFRAPYREIFKTIHEIVEEINNKLI